MTREPRCDTHVVYCELVGNKEIKRTINYFLIFMEAIALCSLVNKIHLLRRVQHRFIVIALYTYATCFGPFSGHH